MRSPAAIERVRLLHVRAQMLARCYDPANKGFADYGGRGIEVCAAWRASAQSFIADMGPRPEGWTLDRIDNDGDYEPGNVRWATRTEQNQNRRNCIRVELDGETVVLKEACRRLGLPYRATHKRLQRGWPMALALSAPPLHRPKTL